MTISTACAISLQLSNPIQQFCRLGRREQIDGLLAELARGCEVALIPVALGYVQAFEGLIFIALHRL